MTHITKRLSAFPLAVAMLYCFSLQSAQAERKSLLDDTPAVRHKLLLLKKRVELAPSFESTINSDFRHTLSAGLKLEYHLSELFSFGVLGFYGASINTGLTDKIIKGLPDKRAPDPAEVGGDPTPSKNQFKGHLNSIPLHGAAFIGISPWNGKLAAFGKFFVNFDFYFQGGLAFASLKSDCTNTVCDDKFPEGNSNVTPVLLPDNNPNDDPTLNDGLKLGVYVGGGIHVFMNDFVALDFTVRDYLFSDNPSGLDFNGDLTVTEDDSRFLNHLFMGVGISILLPTKVKRTK